VTESIHNDGQGIQLTVTLTERCPSSKKHPRTNAKLPSSTKVVYIHEDAKFLDSVVIILAVEFDRRDLCKGDLDTRGHLEAWTPFTMEYSIPRNTTLKNVGLFSQSDWKTFMKEASVKGQAKLLIKEKEVSITKFSCNAID